MSKQQKGNYAELVKWDNQNYTATSTLSYNNNSFEDMKRRIMLKWNESKLWQIQHRKNKLFLVFAKRFSTSVFSWCESCCERVCVFFFSPHFILIHLFVRHWSNSECWANNRFHIARLFELFQMETSAKRKRNRDTTKPNTSESEATALPQRHIPCIEKKNQLWQCAYQTVIPVLLLCCLVYGTYTI